MKRALFCAVLVCSLAACPGAPVVDAGSELDASVAPDAGAQVDSGLPDAGATDAGVDAGMVDAGLDAGPPGSLQWNTSFGSTGSQDALASTVDSAGNLLVTGRFENKVDFGGGELTSAGGTDIFIARFQPDGKHLWSKRFGDSASFQQANAIATDRDNNVVIAGYFTGSVDFGGGALTSAGAEDIFVARFDSQGNHLWSKRFGDVTGYQFANGIAIDRDGNVVVVGEFDGTVDFGGGALVGAGVRDVFLARFAADGTHRWSKRFGDSSSQRGTAVGVNAAGEVYIGVDFTFTVNFGGTDLVSAGSTDLALAKFDAAGNHLWSKRFGDAGKQWVRALSVLPAGDVVVAGDYEGALNLGGTEHTGASPARPNIYVARFTTAGAFTWSKAFGDDNPQFLLSMATDPAGNVVLAGRHKAVIDFGGGPLPDAVTYHFYLAKLDKDGSHVWSKSFGDTGDYVASALATDAYGFVYLAGRFWGTLNLGGTPLQAPNADYNIFLARFAP